MTCANCGKDAPDILHEFFEGRREAPRREWSIVAPLYFKSNADYTAAVEGYCGPTCATARLADGMM